MNITNGMQYVIAYVFKHKYVKMMCKNIKIMICEKWKIKNIFLEYINDNINFYPIFTFLFFFFKFS